MKDKHQYRIMALHYLEHIWHPWKKHFAFAWTSQHRHFGTVVTSRIESAHATLKRYLEVNLSVLGLKRNAN